MTAELTVIVPTFNETGNLSRLVDTLNAVLEDIQWHLIIVDDDSPDHTADAVRKLARQDDRVTCIQRLGRRGLSSACIEGMMASASPYLAILDADLQHDASLLPAMLAILKLDNLDCVIGSRYVAGGSPGSLSTSRAYISRISCKLGNKLLGLDIKDPMSGFFVVKREFMERTVRHVYGKGFKILLDMIISSEHQVKIKEIPYTMQARQAGESKLGASVVYEYLALLVNKIVLRVIPPRFVLFSIVGALGVAVHLSTLWLVYRFAGHDFLHGQALAILVAMTHNFFLNNAYAFRDHRLQGLSLLRGLFSFYIVCSLGAFINLLVADWLHETGLVWWQAGLAGSVIGAIWNYLAATRVTWNAK